MRPGELVVATTVGGTDHIAYLYKGGAIFALCGLPDGLTPIEGEALVDCRRCRVEAAKHLREQLHELSDLDVQVTTTEQRIDYLQRVLGGGE